MNLDAYADVADGRALAYLVMADTGVDLWRRVLPTRELIEHLRTSLSQRDFRRVIQSGPPRAVKV